MGTAVGGGKNETVLGVRVDFGFNSATNKLHDLREIIFHEEDKAICF